MVKKSVLQSLNTKDRKILLKLDINARQSDVEIGRKVKLGKEIVNYRIKRLLNLGILGGFYTMIDFSKLGYRNIRVYIKFQTASLEKEKEIFDYLVKNKNTFEVIKADGDWDLVFTVLVKNIDNFFKIWDEFQLKYKEYIYKKEISLFHKYIHYPRFYLINKPNLDHTGLITGGSKEIEVDDIDWGILKNLATNARMSLVDLARKVKLSPGAVRYRMKQLREKRVILRYKANLYLSKIGYRFFKVDIELRNVAIKKELKQFVRQHPNIIAENIPLGGSDFQFDLEAKSYGEFLRIINEIRENFKENIKLIKYYSATGFRKILYLPPEK